jgi:hypothetical protein
MAHPDDAEFLCAGTLILLKRALVLVLGPGTLPLLFEPAAQLDMPRRRLALRDVLRGKKESQGHHPEKF